MSEERFWVIGTTRDPRYRLKRARAAQRHRHLQFICGNQIRLLPGRAQPLRPDFLQKYAAELSFLQQRGQLEVRVNSPKGRKYKFPEVTGSEVVAEAISNKIIETLEEPSPARSLVEEVPVAPVEPPAETAPEPVIEPELEPEVQVEAEPTAEVKPRSEEELLQLSRKELISLWVEYGNDESALEGLTKKQIVSKMVS